MSIQSIIDKAQQIEIDRRRMVSQSVSRSQRIKTAERSTAQPWKFKVTPSAGLKWEDTRGIIEVITLHDRVTEYEINLSNNPGMNYITEYQGEMIDLARDSLTISTSTTSTLVLTNLPDTPKPPDEDPTSALNATDVMFAVGDLIQPMNSRYPYTVTAEVLRGTGSTVTVPLHRPIITSEGINLMGQGVKIGNSCTWRVIVSGLPTFTLIPIKRVQFTGDFELIEKVI